MHRILGWLSFFLAANIYAEEITWEALPKLVQERNGRVAAMKEKTRAAEVLTGHTLRSFQPRIDAAGGYEHGVQRTRSHYTQPYFGVEGRLNLFASGKDLQEENLREARLQIAQEAARMSESEVLFETRKLFLDWLVADESMKIYDQARSANSKGIQSASRRIHRGLGTTTDRIEFELHEKDLAQEYETLQHEKLILQILLAGLLGFEEPKTLAVKGKLEHIHNEALLADLNSITAQSPTVSMAYAYARESTALSRQAYRWWAPNVDLFGGQYLYTFRNREEYSAIQRMETAFGIELRFTLWDGNSTAVARWRGISQNAFRMDSLQTHREMDAKVHALQEDLRHAHDVVHLVEEKTPLNGTYLKQSLSEYERGVKQSPDVLLAFQKSLRLNEELVHSRYNYRLAQAKLLKELGQ